LNLGSEALRSFNVGASEALQRIVAAGQTAKPERDCLTCVTADVGAVLFDFDGTLTATPGERALRRGKVSELRERTPMLEPRLKRLREAGLVLGIISKSSEATVVAALTEVGLRDLFEGPILTKAVGLEGKAGFIRELCEPGGGLVASAGKGEAGVRRVLLIDDDVFELERCMEAGVQTYAAPENGGLQPEDFDELFVSLELDEPSQLDALAEAAAEMDLNISMHKKDWSFPVDEEITRIWVGGWTSMTRGVAAGDISDLGSNSGLFFRDLYSVQEVLGCGSFGAVARGTYAPDGRQCALKSVQKKQGGKLYYTNFIEKGQWAFLLQATQEAAHPNMISYYDFLISEDCLYTTMEPLNGPELLTYLQENAPLTDMMVHAISQQMMTAIKHIHSLLGRGLIHRDVKLENLRFRSDDTDCLVLLDFGLCCYATPTERRDVVGTLLYTAPEVFSRNYSTQIDVWSAGVVLYIILTGRPPWYQDRRGFRNRKVIDQVSIDRALELPELVSLPPSVNDLVRRMLALNPEVRITADAALQHEWFAESPKFVRRRSLSELASCGTPLSPGKDKYMFAGRASKAAPIKGYLDSSLHFSSDGGAPCKDEGPVVRQGETLEAAPVESVNGEKCFPCC